MSQNAKPFRVLAIDGGGILGLIPASILAFVEEEAGSPVSDLFDLVIGTSTGGILSVGLTVPDDAGKPKFSAQDLKGLYANKGASIFEPWDSKGPIAEAEGVIGSKLADLDLVRHDKDAASEQDDGRPVPVWRGLLHPKYTASGLETLLKGLMGDAPLSRPVAGTHAAANSFDIDAFGLKMFRSWEAQASADDDFPMWAVARATSAAPTYFPPAQVTSLNGRTTLHCVDGGVAVNDPVLVGVAEARHILARQSTVDAASTPVFAVSIGTGAKPSRSIPYEDVKDAGAIGWFEHGLMNVLLEGPNVATNRIADVLLPEGSFYRYQAPLSGPGFSVSDDMDDCSPKNIEAMEKASADFISREKASLMSVISKLKGEGLVTG